MQDLFKVYRERKMEYEATMIGQNRLNKNPGNFQAFIEYFDYLLSLSQKTEKYEEIETYLDRAKIAFSIIVDNANIKNEELVAKLTQCRDRILNEGDRLVRIANENAKAAREKEEKLISTSLKKIEGYIGQIKNCEDEAALENLLTTIFEIDHSLQDLSFTSKQEKEYAKLAKIQEEETEKIRKHLGTKRMMEYNIEASSSFKYVFDSFVKEEKAHSGNIKGFFDVLEEHFFVYKTEQLYSETIAYQNYVYGYILSKLSPEGKYDLTEFAIKQQK